MDTGSYRFAELEHDEELLQDIHRLESKMQQKLGKDITLIAYSKGKTAEGAYSA